MAGMRGLTMRIGVAALVVAGMLAAPGAAHAAFEGVNGKLASSGCRCDEAVTPAIHSLAPDGSGVGLYQGRIS